MPEEPRNRIVMLTPLFSGRDGVSLVSRVAASALSAGGFAVDVYSLGHETEEPLPAGVTLWSAEDSRLRYPCRVVSEALGRQSERVQVLAMHVHLGVLGMPWVWRGASLTVFLHGIEAWKPLRARERVALRAASTVLANSADTVRRFVEFNPQFNRLPVGVCHLGIERLCTSVDGPRLRPERFALVVGRLVGESRYKGHDELLELWPEILRQFPDFQLVIAGDGTDRPRLEAKAAELGLHDAVHFTGLVDDQTLARLYRDCEFFVMPSIKEGFGLVYLEAMRAGKACIASPGAAEEVVLDGVTGIIADPKSNQLLRAMITLIGQPQRSAEMGANGRRRFLEHFTAERFGEKLLSAFHSDTRTKAICAE